MTSWGKVLRGAALTFAAAVVLAGCDDAADGPATSTAAAATTTNVATKSADPDVALWNPCELPESAISGTGLDPASKEKDVAGVDFTGWKVCGWRAIARWYDLTIYSGSPTLEEYMQRPDFEHFTPRTVGSRRAVEFLDVGDTQRLGCSIAIAVRGGTVSFGVLTRYSVGKQGDPCVQVGRHVDDLAKYLPEG